MPQIAAHVTALARIKLYRHMVAAGDSLAYCDTDSIITSSQLDTSTALGDLKNEYPGVTFSGVFLAPKLYMLSGSDGSVKVVAKGIRERTKETFDTLASGGTVSSFELEKLGKLAHAGFRKPQMFELKKSLKFKSVKRTWDGNRTQPIKLEDW
jgi:hypothetical protein